MECFGQFDSENAVCNRCWLQMSCKTVRQQTERKRLQAVKLKGVSFKTFDGIIMAQKELPHTIQLRRFSEKERERSESRYGNFY